MRRRQGTTETDVDVRTDLLLRGRRPRIALVAHDIGAEGGMQLVCTELLQHAAGCVDFVVVSRTLDEELRELVEWRQVPVVARPKPLRFVMFFIIGAIRLFRTRADLVHTVGAIVPNRVDLVSVHHCHAAVVDQTGGLASAGTPWMGRLNGRIARLLALLAERWRYRPGRSRILAAVSPSIGGELARHYPGVPVFITPNGVNADTFAPSSTVRGQVRQRERVGDDDVVALFVGGDWHRKGLGTAIRALALAHLRGTKRLRLWVVGRGDEKHFRRMAQDCGVVDHVRFAGCPTTVQDFYQAADVFVLPSLYEGFSLVALEASACGLPLVATRVGIIQELVGRDEAGLLVEPTPADVGAALARLAADPALRARLGQTGRQRAKAYTWKSSAESVLALYRELLVPDRIRERTRA